MEDLRKWLAEAGLEKYAETLAEADIDVEILPHLSDDDLKEIGLPVGARRKLQRRLESAGSPSTESSTQPAAAVPRPLAERLADASAQRRQVTVMFVDLVDSTQLATRVDPEELATVNRTYQGAATRTIEQLGGFVARYMGDGVLAYFGYPEAHEDDAERAVRAGLALARNVPDLDVSVPLSVRVGIATGQVVIGEIIGTGVSQEVSVVGETPNLAARLQGEAEPNTVVVAESTVQLVGRRFRLDPVPPRVLKGLDEPVSFSVVRAVNRESRYASAAADCMTSLAGRDEELAMLRRRWLLATEGEAQVVLVGGEAGVGKSRLVESLIEGENIEEVAIVRLQCSPYHVDSAFMPVIEHLELICGITDADSPQVRGGRLANRITGALEPYQQALLQVLLSIPTDAERFGNASAQRRKFDTVELLIQLLVERCRARPTCVLLEDTHWIDPSTQELFAAALEHLSELSVLVVFTHRPGHDPDWAGFGNVTRLLLNRLARADVRQMIAEMSGEVQLSDAVCDRLIEKADGVPLYAEEMVRSVLEVVSNEAIRGKGISGQNIDRLVPATLHDSLMARLDELGEARGLVQAAAVLGREFSGAMLAAVVEKSTDSLRQDMQVLISAGLLMARGRETDVRYIFKHALVRDVAYQSQLHSERRAIHGKVADALRGRFPAYSEAHPDVVARHLMEAERSSEAELFWSRAGDLYRKQSALMESAACFDQAHLCLSRLPRTADVLKRTVNVILAQRPALWPLGDFKRSIDALRVAETTALELGDEPTYTQVLLFTAFAYSVNAQQYHRGIDACHRAIASPGYAADPASAVLSNLYLCISHMHLGEYESSVAAGRRGLAALTPELQFPHQVIAPAVSIRFFLSRSLTELGELEEAEAVAREAAAIARERARGEDEGNGYAALAFIQFKGGRLDESLASAKASLDALERMGNEFAFFSYAAIAVRIAALVESNNVPAALAEATSPYLSSPSGTHLERVVEQQRLRARFLSGARDEARTALYDLIAEHRARSEMGSVLWGEFYLAGMLEDGAERAALLNKTRELAAAAKMRILEERCAHALS